MTIGRVFSLSLTAAVLAGSPAAAQEEPMDTVSEVLDIAADPRAARAPFGPGELLEYNVKLGIFSVGDGHLALHGVDTVRGQKAYRATMAIEGGIPLARVDDEFQSWFDVRSFQSWRFIRDINEVNYHSFRHYEMYPDRRRWEREDNDEFGTLGSTIPLDDVSFIYFLRTLPLEVGKTYTLNRYFKDDGNPVVIRVLRKDRREVPAGEFETIVVKPIIKTDGLFGEGGNAEIHFTDDERRIMVYLRSEIPVVGSITLHLERIREGLPLHPDSRAEAEARLSGSREDVGSGR